MHEITIVDGRGLVVLGPTRERKEDLTLPRQVTERIIKAHEEKESELQDD